MTDRKYYILTIERGDGNKVNVISQQEVTKDQYLKLANKQQRKIHKK